MSSENLINNPDFRKTFIEYADFVKQSKNEGRSKNCNSAEYNKKNLELRLDFLNQLERFTNLVGKQLTEDEFINIFVMAIKYQELTEKRRALNRKYREKNYDRMRENETRRYELVKEKRNQKKNQQSQSNDIIFSEDLIDEAFEDISSEVSNELESKINNQNEIDLDVNNLVYDF